MASPIDTLILSARRDYHFRIRRIEYGLGVDFR